MLCRATSLSHSSIVSREAAALQQLHLRSSPLPMMVYSVIPLDRSPHRVVSKPGGSVLRDELPDLGKGRGASHRPPFSPSALQPFSPSAPFSSSTQTHRDVDRAQHKHCKVAARPRQWQWQRWGGIEPDSLRLKGISRFNLGHSVDVGSDNKRTLTNDVTSLERERGSIKGYRPAQT